MEKRSALVMSLFTHVISLCLLMFIPVEIVIIKMATACGRILSPFLSAIFRFPSVKVLSLIQTGVSIASNKVRASHI